MRKTSKQPQLMFKFFHAAFIHQKQINKTTWKIPGACFEKFCRITKLCLLFQSKLNYRFIRRLVYFALTLYPK